MKGFFFTLAGSWLGILSGMILLLVTLSASADQVYTWTDDDGVRHFSKTPPEPGISSDSINTEVRNSSVIAGDGRMPEVGETRRCSAEELSGLRQRITFLDRDFNVRMAECDKMRRDGSLIGSYSECQRASRVWLTETRVNYQHALDSCHGR